MTGDTFFVKNRHLMVQDAYGRVRHSTVDEYYEWKAAQAKAAKEAEAEKKRKWYQ